MPTTATTAHPHFDLAAFRQEQVERTSEATAVLAAQTHAEDERIARALADRRSALRLDEGAGLDLLEALPSTTVLASSLRPGMVLLDDLDTPVAIVDHRSGSARGTLRFLVNDLERGGWTEVRLGERARVTVAAR